MAAGVLVLGMGVAAALILSFIRALTGPLVPFTTVQPFEGEIPAGAERTIYREAGGPELASITCRVTHTGTGEEVELRPGGTLTLQRKGKEFFSVASFEADRAGRHRVACPASAPDPVPLAIGPRVRLFATIASLFAAILVFLLAAGAAAAIIAVTAVRRSGQRRRLEREVQGGLNR